MLSISVYKKCGYGNFNHRYNVSPTHLPTLLGVGGILGRYTACTTTAYEVARDCREFERHCSTGCCRNTHISVTQALHATGSSIADVGPCSHRGLEIIKANDL
jgi:hypothetical protein